MAVFHKKVVSVSMVLAIACVSGCTCPQSGGARGGRSLGSQTDPSGGSLAFFGSLRSFFAESPNTTGGRTCTDADLTDSEATTTSASTAGAKAGDAALSIR